MNHDLLEDVFKFDNVLQYVTWEQLTNLLGVCSLWDKLLTQYLIKKILWRCKEVGSPEDKDLLLGLIYEILLYPSLHSQLTSVLSIDKASFTHFVTPIFQLQLQLQGSKETMRLASICYRKYAGYVEEEVGVELERRFRMTRKEPGEGPRSWARLAELSSSRSSVHSNYVDYLEHYFQNKTILPPQVLGDIENEYYSQMLQPFLFAKNFTTFKNHKFIDFMDQGLNTISSQNALHSLPALFEQYLSTHQDKSAASLVYLFGLIQRKLVSLLPPCSVFTECYKRLIGHGAKFQYNINSILVGINQYITRKRKDEEGKCKFSLLREESQEQLQKAREQYQARKIIHKRDMREVQDQFTSTCKGIVSNFWDVLTHFMGSPPSEIAIIAVGSMSRNEMCPYSDLEFFILTDIDVPSKKNLKLTPENEKEVSLYCYLETFLWLFSFFIASIGEDTTCGGIDGFSIDSRFSPGIENKELILTPSKAVNYYFKNFKDLSWFIEIRNFGMFNCCYLCGSENGKSLLMEYKNGLKEWLNTKLENDHPLYNTFSLNPSVPITWREIFTLGHWWAASVGTEIPDFEGGQCSLKDLIRPLITFSLTMGCYLEIEENQPLSIFRELRKNHYPSIPYAFVSLLQQSYFILSKMRILCDFKAKCHSDTIIQSQSPAEENLIVDQAEQLSIIRSLISKIHLYFDDIKNNFEKEKKMRISKKHLLDKIVDDYIAKQKQYFQQDQAIPNEHILMYMRDLPDPDGKHPYQEFCKKQFLGSLSKLLTKEYSPIQITSTQHGQQYLNPKVIDYLMNSDHTPLKKPILKKDGKFNTDWKTVYHSSHLVFPLNTQDIKVYFKVMPDCPGNGEAIDSLAMLLVGGGIAFTDLWLWNSKGERCIVLVSQAIRGIRLSDALFKDPQLKIRPVVFSQQFLLSLIARWEDCQPNNIIYEEQSKNITLIDTERSFVESFEDYKDNSSVLVKTPLYCFDVMEVHVHPLMTERFLMVDAIKLIKLWVQRLLEKCNQFHDLFPDNTLSLIDLATKTIDHLKGKSTTTILPFIDPHIINDIYSKIHQIQERLLKFPESSHMDILSIVDRRLAEHYYNSLKLRQIPLDANPLARYAEVTKKTKISFHEHGRTFSTTLLFKTYSSHTIQCSEKNPGNLILNNKENYKNWAVVEADYKKIVAKLEECANYHSIEDVLKQNNKVEAFRTLPVYIQQRIINDIEWKNIPLEYQKMLLKFIQKTAFNFSSLNLAYCTMLDYKLLSGICHSYVQELNLSDVSMNKQIIEYLSKLPYLRKLRLRNFNLQKVEFKYPVFPSLTYMDLRNSEKLELFEINAHKLEYLNFSNCLNMKDLKLFTPNLTFIGLDNCTLLRSKMIWPHNEGYPRLLSFSCKNTSLEVELAKHKVVEITSNEQLPTIDLNQAILLDSDIETLKLESFPLDLQKVRRLSAAFHSQLKRIYLADNKCSGDILFTLAQAFPPGLHTISIEDNDIEQSLIDIIFKTQTNLQCLSLAANQLNPKYGELFTRVSSNLKVLKLCNNYLMDSGVRYLSSTLKNHPTLEVLYLCKNNISPDGELDMLISTNNTIRELYLNGNILKDDGIRKLATALGQNDSLCVLSLQFNQITERGVGYLNEEYERRNAYTIRKIPLQIKLTGNDFDVSKILATYPYLHDWFGKEENCLEH